MKILLSLVCLSFLTGCGGVSTNQIVSLRRTTHDLQSCNSELSDNLQASLWGMTHNKDELVKREFTKTAFQIAGEPDFEEKQFSENATMDDLKQLQIETADYLKQKTRLESQLTDVEKSITDSHSSENSILKLLLIGISGLVLVLFLAYAVSKLTF